MWISTQNARTTLECCNFRNFRNVNKNSQNIMHEPVSIPVSSTIQTSCDQQSTQDLYCLF